MKTKKFLVPSILFAFVIIAYIAASIIFCYTTKPAVATGEFPFSITYEYKGETGTLEGVYKCEFSGSKTIFGEHKRFWDGEADIEYDGEYEFANIIYQSEGTVLTLREHMAAGYFMGDPLYKDYYIEYASGEPEPYVEYYDYNNNIFINEENYDEILEELDFRIVDYTYAEPIENSFSFSGIYYGGDNVSIFILITFVFLVLCVVFVRKDKEYKYSALDKLGVFFNFAIGIFAFPIIAITCIFYEITGGSGFDSQLIFNIPPFMILCLGLSVVFRRKGFRKTGFLIQFPGVAVFAILCLIDWFTHYL